MARLRSGILGNLRGKVSGVVGSQWKDKNYLREYVKPANPRTAAQVVQRDLMKNSVAFCKPLVGPVFNSYTDKFQKSMSGFNFFIKQNITEFVAGPTYTNVIVTEGKLNPLANAVSTYNAGTGEHIITFDKNLGNNGSDTDKVFAVVYDSATELWYFAAAEVDRSTETMTLTLPTGGTPTQIISWIWPIKYIGTVVDSIGLSIADIAAAP